MGTATIKIDVCDMPCPEPLIKVKNSLKGITKESLKLNEFEIVGNGMSSQKSVEKWLSEQGFVFSTGTSVGGRYVIILSGKNDVEKTSPKLSKKMMVIKDDKLGEGELGSVLIQSVMKSLLQSSILPSMMLFLNRGVLLTTDNKEVENAEIVEALKALEAMGVEIFSCGTCLSYFALTERLKVGKIGNMVDSVGNMLNLESAVVL